MMARLDLTRRGLIAGGGALLLASCDRLTTAPRTLDALKLGERATYGWQRLIQGRGALAREYGTADLSPTFKANGSISPQDGDYLHFVEDRFASWRLRIDGLVARPFELSLAEMRQLPARSQITRHDCVEGWSAIGGWRGPQLGPLVRHAGLLPGARFAVFHCMDTLEGEPAKGGEQSAGRYYESIDLTDVFHPQTILAHSLNGAPLAVAHGAPLRLRVERQLGYKHAKYVQRIELVSSLAPFGMGHGGYWPDRGYEWYAGI